MGDGNDRGMFYLVLPEQVVVRVRRADHGWLCVGHVTWSISPHGAIVQLSPDSTTGLRVGYSSLNHSSMALETVGLTESEPSEITLTELDWGGETGTGGWETGTGGWEGGWCCKNCLAIFKALEPSLVLDASLEGISLRVSCYLLLSGAGRGGGKFQGGGGGKWGGAVTFITPGLLHLVHIRYNTKQLRSPCLIWRSLVSDLLVLGWCPDTRQWFCCLHHLGSNE